MKRLVVFVLIIIFCGVAAFAVGPESWLFAGLATISAGFLVPLTDEILTTKLHWRLAWYSVRTWRSSVRLSVSYLYRIEVDNLYLLVKGHRFDQYQPVGGVYKFHASSAESRKKLRVRNDDLLEPDPLSEGDLRVRVPGRNLIPFVHWFNQGYGREAHAFREFHEELIASGIIDDLDQFRVIDFDVVERYYHPLRYSNYAKSQELLIADILELIPSEEQLSSLRSLQDRSDPRYIWATEDQIRRRGAITKSTTQPTSIAETAEWTL